MTNTYARVNASLIALLGDKNHKVIALRGKWGTGKTELWKSLKKEASITPKKPIYVSLFGVRTINELKLRVLQSVSTTDSDAIKKLVKTGAGVAAGLLKRFAGYSAEDAAVLWVSSLVRDRLIVVDDVERKHSSLDTDEVMGFLSEFSESYGAQFLVLLNLEKLNDDLWNRLQEKVIDGEVVLDPSPEEAFDIAVNGDVSGYVASARVACSTLKLTNIRVIRRVLRVLKRVSRTNNDMCTAYDRWVPSTVLLVAMHYRALDNPPTFDFLKSFNTFHAAFREVRGEEASPEESKWGELLSNLGIDVTDEYETLLAKYLQNGLMDEDKFKEILERYQQEKEQGNWYAKRREFYLAWWWDPSLSIDDLKKTAHDISKHVTTLAPREASELVGVVDHLDSELSRKILDEWLHAADTNVQFKNINTHDFDMDMADFHPEIHKKVQELVARNYPPLTLVEAVLKIAETKSWGNRETFAIENSSKPEYVTAIKSLKLSSLRVFLVEHLKWYGEQLGNDYFPKGLNNFIEACKEICLEDPSGRLTTMIKRTFNSSGKSHLLP